MYALFLILNDVYMLDEIHEIFYEIGVGATTLDSMGMGKVLLEHHVDAPMFSRVKKLIKGNKPYNKTIVSIINDEEKLKIAMDKIKERLDDLKTPGIGFMFVVPVLEAYGSKI